MISLTNMESIETERLLLRKFILDDAPLMYKNWASDDEVSKYMLWNTHKTVEETETIIKLWVETYKSGSMAMQYAIVLKEIDEPIGVFTLNINVKHHYAEIAYCIGRNFQNIGLAKEAISNVVTYVFEKLNCVRVSAEVLANNKPSINLLKKCSFLKEGIQLKKIFSKRGKFEDLLIYGIINNNYKKVENMLNKRD